MEAFIVTLLAAGGLLASMNSLIESTQRAQAHDVNAQMASYNARIEDQRAKAVRQTMGVETGIMTREGRRFKAKQKVAIGASGADPSTGTPLLIAEEQAGEIARDIMRHRRNRLIEAQSLEAKADMYRYQSKVSKHYEKQEKKAGLFSAAFGVGKSFFSGD